MKEIAILTLLLALGRCAAGPTYSVALLNRTDAEISDADVLFDGFQSIGGWIAPRSGKANLDVTAPIPEQATVQWRTTDGIMHRQVVFVRKVVPHGFHDRIFFVIRPDNTVEVRTTPPQR